MGLGFKGTVIAVTGGGAGMGEATMRACLEEGSTVVVVSHASGNV